MGMGKIENPFLPVRRGPVHLIDMKPNVKKSFDCMDYLNLE